MKLCSTFAILLLLLVSCGKDKPDESVEKPDQLALQFVPFFANDTLHLDSTYQLDSGDNIRFSDLKFFISSCKNGANNFIPVSFFDYRSSGFKLATINGNAFDFAQLSFDLGVPTNWNHADPSTWSTSSPLNITNAGDMYWGWNPGYIFLKIEAKADTIPNGIDLFDHFITYHIGTDAAISALNFAQIDWSPLQNKLSKANFKCDLKAVLDNTIHPINIRNENTTHSGAGEAVLTEKVRANFSSSITPL